MTTEHFRGLQIDTKRKTDIQGELYREGDKTIWNQFNYCVVTELLEFLSARLIYHICAACISSPYSGQFLWSITQFAGMK